MTRPDRPDEKPEYDPFAVKPNYWERRREKIVAEIQANRRGEYTVPTWVLTLILVAMVAGFVSLLVFT